MSPGARPARIVLTTFGSLGDLHPYLAIGLALAARGHRVTLATHEGYRRRIEREGLSFHPVPPDLADFGDQATLMRRLMDQRTGSEAVVRTLVLPFVRASYDALEVACAGADLLVTHPITYAAHVLAERKAQELRWASAVLQPMIFFSAYDPPVLPQAPWFARLRPLGPAFHRVVFGLGRAMTRPWMKPVDDLRRSVGLSPATEHPMFEGAVSPALHLALFSSVLARPQPDWPEQTVVTGFPVYDRDEDGRGMPPELLRFLEAGPAPIVFTLGSSAVMDAGSFFRVSVEAAERLARRAVLLVGREKPDLPERLPEGMLAVPYAPHSELMPRAATIVHQGGVGTTAQALASGRPMLVMPYSHDQQDHAARIERLGVGRAIARGFYRTERVVRELGRLLEDSEVARRAASVSARVRAEDGARTAADELEALLDRGGVGVGGATLLR
ncbi:MAG: glycosyltransferase [Candidatus Eiseniibacteriota bacterium]